MYKKLFLVVLIICLYPLPGCAPLIVAAGASAGGVVIYDERSLDTMYHDAEITEQAQYTIKSDPDLKKLSHLNVSSFNRTVLIVGQVSQAELRAKAYKLVSEVSGITRIHNAITVENLTSAKTRSNDIWITTKVKSALLAEKGLRSAQIKVVTENKTVYLLGLVTQKNGDIASNVARSVTGVNKVVRAFEYLQ
jgi:osmotically-inducible protein OsmY